MLEQGLGVQTPYDKDDVVVAYTGDRGERNFGPGTLSATVSDGQVSLSWAATVGATNYKLLSSSTGFPPMSCPDSQVIHSGTDTSFVHTNLLNNKSYYYRLCISDTSGTTHAGLKLTAKPANKTSSVQGSDDCDTLKQQSGQPFAFSPNGNFTGARVCGGSAYLSYEGHPGIDYAFSYGTALYAAVSGNVSYDDTSGYSKPEKYHVLTITPSDPSFKVLHPHLSSYYDSQARKVVKRIFDAQGNATVVDCFECPQPGQQVTQGTSFIGYVGDFQVSTSNPSGWGGVADHLHFEVRRQNGNKYVAVDPYGWLAQGQDPYTPGGTKLWQ